MNKLKKATILLMMLVLLTTFLLVGCKPNNSNNVEVKPTIKTLEDVERFVTEKYCYDDGSFKTYYWENGAKSLHYYDNIIEELTSISEGTTKITGFSVQLLKGLDDVEDWYLVEFEPTGHILGRLNRTNVGIFLPYRSPFKLANIDKNNRYLYAAEDHGFFHGICYCTMHNGYLCDFGSYVKNLYVQPLNVDMNKMNIYDQETKEWSQVNVKDILLDG